MNVPKTKTCMSKISVTTGHDSSLNYFSNPNKNILYRTRYSMVESPQHLVGALPQLQTYTVTS